MFETIADPGRIEPWGQAVDGPESNWADVFDGFRSTVDWRGGADWSELAPAHPDAKVIPGVRDPQRWYDGVYQFVKQEPSEEAEPTRRLRPRMVWDGTFDGRFEGREHAVEVFERHNDGAPR